MTVKKKAWSLKKPRARPPRKPTATAPSAPADPVVTIEFDAASGKAPIPPDPMALAHWCGIKTKTLWYFILNRKTLYRTITIPKPKGGVRVLHEPMPQLKFVQRMLLDRILSKYPEYAHVGAYEEDKGVKYTTARHAGHAIVLELDIKDFFGSTTRKHVRDFFRSQHWPRESAHAAADLVTIPITDELSVVPQGAPCSPTVCNLVGNLMFDKPIMEFLKAVDPGWAYTRYSDNLIISHPIDRPKEEVEKVLNTVKALLAKARYRAHPKKVKIMRAKHPKKPQRLLGLTVNKTPNVPVEEYRRLRAQIHRAETKGLKAVTGVPSGVGPLPHIEGRLNYYLHINPASTKLQRLKARCRALQGKA